LIDNQLIFFQIIFMPLQQAISVNNGNNFIKTHTLIEPILKKNGFKVVNEAGFLYFWK